MKTTDILLRSAVLGWRKLVHFGGRAKLTHDGLNFFLFTLDGWQYDHRPQFESDLRMVRSNYLILDGKIELRKSPGDYAGYQMKVKLREDGDLAFVHDEGALVILTGLSAREEEAQGAELEKWEWTEKSIRGILKTKHTNHSQ